MATDLLFSLIGFAFAASVTPGPNNLMLMASGARFGFRRTLPHMLGVSIGFPVMVLAIGLGLGEVFRANPQLRDIMKWLSAAFLLYLAWRIAGAGGLRSSEARARPLTMIEAGLFQWANPKGWAVALSVIPIYASGRASALMETGTIASVFFVVALVTCATWIWFGDAIARLISNPRRARLFNIAMAVLMFASVVPMLFE